MKCNRIIIFFVVFCFFLLSFLPNFVVKAAAVTELGAVYEIAPYIVDKGINTTTYRWTRSFSFFSWTTFLHPNEFSTAMRSAPPYKFTGYGGPNATYFYMSPMRNSSSSKEDFVSDVPFGQYLSLGYFAFEPYALYVTLNDITLASDANGTGCTNTVQLRVRFDFFDNMGNTISSEFYDISNNKVHAVTGSASAYSEIPEDTFFFSFVIVCGAGVIPEGEQLYFDFDSVELKFMHRGYPSDATDPYEPTVPPSSGGNNFDDSGIIDSVTSSADKVIDSVDSAADKIIGGIDSSIDDQTDQIGDMIDGVRDDLGDVNQNLEDMNSNIQDANDKLDDANTTLTDTLDEVKSLPEKILDGIRGLFVPDEDEMAAYNDQWSELLRSRFGALYESADIIASVGSAFTTSEATNVIDFPEVTLDLAGAEFVFGGWEVQVVPEGFDVIVDMLKTMISLLATVAFVNALRNKLDRLMEGV